ncbi:FAD-dependent oxidoreductase [Arthrobacter sp.]|uniref:glycerol-3-phosphate dehydrogenase/oxidase n=1 Tax=Arthrobacter sp. TaxID=1667 RepID=UPI003A91F521
MSTRPTAIGHGLEDLPTDLDVLVVGLGVTGAGVALDAASRGLSVLAVDAHDVAFGTSRFSSKLVHGGLRYLAKGQLGVAHESAVERGILMERTAPHLTRALPMLLPLMSSVGHGQAALAGLGFIAGDVLRLAARTTADTLPHPRRVSRTEALTMAPPLRGAGLRGALLSWDGQLEDDARLVLGIARTAIAHGADVRTRIRAVSVTGTGAELRDELTGETQTVTARKVINATGVWAADLVDVKLKPSRGTHLVLRAETLPRLNTAITVPIPNTTNRFMFLLPQPDGTIYVGLTDVEAHGDIPDVPEPTESEIGFLLDVVSAAFDKPLRRSEVVGAYAGLRPLLDSGGSTADLSRKHAVLTSPTGVITIVGGKLTTYRRMAEDSVDATGLAPGVCRTRNLPLLGAASRDALAQFEGHPRLVRRFGTEAQLVLENARIVTGLNDAELLAPLAPHLPATLAELVFGITHEGAVDVEDLLERRTRISLIPEDVELARPAAERALELVAAYRAGHR